MKQNYPHHSKKERTRLLILRIFACILALLLLGGSFYTIIALLASH